MLERLQSRVFDVVTVEVSLGVGAAVVGKGVTMVAVALTETALRCGCI